MLSELGRRPIIGNSEGSLGDEFDKEIGILLREQRRQDADDRDNELNMYRSGSAPPTVEGSLTAVGGLFNHSAAATSAGVDAFSDFARTKTGNGFTSEEDLRSDPAYLSYYYSNVNLNPRLPPPLLSKEDWRFAQRLQGGSSAIGDRRKVRSTSTGGGGGVGPSLFSLPPGFDLKKQETENEFDEVQSSTEWGGGGLIGLPGIGLGSKQKSFADIFQDDLGRGSPASRHPSRPASRNQNPFTENTDTLNSDEAELAHLHSDLLQTNADLQTSQHVPPPSSYSYAAALGTSLSKSTTPDPQHIARVPSPIPTPIGNNRAISLDKRTIHIPNSFNIGESSDMLSAFSGMNLSNGVQNHHNSNVSSSNYRKGPSSNGGAPGGGLLSSANSSFSNYGLGGYPLSPISTGVGNYNLPPLFENAASAMGLSGMDTSFLGSPNFGSPSSQHTMGRIGNQTLQAPFMDPMYLQYMNDPSVDRNYMGNPYMDLIQKAYIGGALPSPLKFNKNGGGASSSPHNYYGNHPGFGVGLSYPGSPLASPVSPFREFNARYPSGMRNMAAGGLMGGWHLDNMENSFASSLLEEFKSNKAKCFELSEIAGHVVEFSADQYGSRFIQQKLETATTEEKNMVFQEIIPRAVTLMTDVFGNYVIQKFFEHGMAPQRRELADKLFGHVLTLSLQMYGCRVIQKAIEVVELDQKIQMVEELDGHVMRCVRDQNGNHVIQKCIECVPQEHIQFIVTTFFDQVVTLSTHPYGCRVIQRVLEHCGDAKTQSKVMNEILGSVSKLAQDQYGNYVIQHVLEHGNPHERSTIIKELAGNIVQMSQQKFASNVVEKCLTFGDPAERQLLVNEMLGTTDENEPLQAMMKDQFANYVVQKVLETCNDQQREFILSRIKVHLNALKKYTYGKHIVARVEKLVAAGERRIAAQSLPLT